MPISSRSGIRPFIARRVIPITCTATRRWDASILSTCEVKPGGKSSRLKERRYKLGNLSVPVPRAEHLVAMKVQAMKNDPSRTLQELADIGFLIHLPGIDQKEVRKYFEEGGLLNSYEEIRKRT